MLVSFRRNIVVRVRQGADLAAVCLTFLAALAMSRDQFPWPSSEYIFMRIRVVNVLFFGGYLALCFTTFTSCGFYQRSRLSFWRRMGKVLSAVTLLTAVFWALRTPLEFSFATTRFLLTFWLLTFCALSVVYEVNQRMLRFVRSYWGNQRNVIIVGEGLEAVALAKRLTKESDLSYQIMRIIDAQEARGND